MSPQSGACYKALQIVRIVHTPMLMASFQGYHTDALEAAARLSPMLLYDGVGSEILFPLKGTELL